MAEPQHFSGKQRKKKQGNEIVQTMQGRKEENETSFRNLLVIPWGREPDALQGDSYPNGGQKEKKEKRCGGTVATFGSNEMVVLPADGCACEMEERWVTYGKRERKGCVCLNGNWNVLPNLCHNHNHTLIRSEPGIGTLFTRRVD